MWFEQPQDEIDLINQAEKDLANKSNIIRENIDQKEFWLAWAFYLEKHFDWINSEENRTIFFNEVLRYADLLVEDNSKSIRPSGNNWKEMRRLRFKYEKLFKDPTLLPDEETFGVTVQWTVSALKAKFMGLIN
jgi:hypothetical protein